MKQCNDLATRIQKLHTSRLSLVYNQHCIQTLTVQQGNDDKIIGWYKQYLHRDPSAIELKTDVDLYEKYNQTDADIQAGILGSYEYFSNYPTAEAYIRGVYNALLNRTPTKAEVDNGVFYVQQRLRTKLVTSILISDEYQSKKLP